MMADEACGLAGVDYFYDEIERVSMFMTFYNMCCNVCYNLTYLC